MIKRMQIIFFFLLSVSLFLPLNTALSQDADEYGYASLTMTLELEDALRGKNEVAISRAYRDIYQTHYDRLISNYENQQRHTAAEKSKKQRDTVMRYLNDRVKKAEDNEDYFNNVMFVIQAVLIDGADSANQTPPTEPNPVTSNFLPIHEEQTKQNATDMLYGHVASGIPESSSVISSSSSQIYHVDAGLPSPSVPPALSQNNAPTLVPTIVSVSNGGNSGGSDVKILKPLRFANAGLFDATVRAFSFAPAEGVTAGMSRASTVVFRESNPSAYLDLPLGTYVFCYDWDLGTDADNDGYVDYAHRNTGSVTLSGASSDNATSAQVVTLNPEDMNNPNGKCGTTPPVEDAGELTPQELANQGTHTYRIDCPAEELLEAEATVIGFKFVTGGVNVEDESDEWFYNKINANTYTHDYTDTIVATYTFTFTNEGFTLLLVADGSATCIGTRK